jgi:hypothetical protein
MCQINGQSLSKRFFICVRSTVKVWANVFEGGESEFVFSLSKFFQVYFFRDKEGLFEEIMIFNKVWPKVFGVGEFKSTISFLKNFQVCSLFSLEKCRFIFRFWKNMSTVRKNCVYVHTLHSIQSVALHRFLD